MCIRDRLLIIHGRQSVQNQERPYHVDRTTSRPLCEVKRRRATLVLRWGTTWEALVLFLFFACANDHGHAHSSFLPAVLYVPPPNRPFIHSFIHSVLKLLLCVHYYSHFIYNRPVPTLFYTCCGPSDSKQTKKSLWGGRHGGTSGGHPRFWYVCKHAVAFTHYSSCRCTKKSWIWILDLAAGFMNHACTHFQIWISRRVKIGLVVPVLQQR